MKKNNIFAFFIFSILLSSVSHAAPVQAIKIEGNQRVESETILSYVPIKVGDEVEQNKLDHALKELFATGYFADVHVRQEGTLILIKVEENPIINRVAYEGNNKLKDDAIKEEIRLRPREVLSKTKVQEAQQRLLEIYRRMGRFGARVEPKIIKLPENRVDLVFEINEGTVTYIRKIFFVGNKHFGASTLEKQLQSKRYKWFRFFATDDVYDPDRFNNDKQALEKFYKDHGYADFRVLSSIAELSPDQKDFVLTFTVDEGPVFSFGKSTIHSKLEKMDIKKLEEHLKSKEGETFSGKNIDQTVTALVDAAGTQGYAFVSVEPVLEKDREKNIVHVTYEIKEGQRVYVEKIIFAGNSTTRDEVLRREMGIHEGDAYNAAKLKKAERNLKDLNYFKTVNVEVEQGSTPDQARLVVKVEEQSTGEMQLAGGYSTMDGPLANLRIVQRNFRGAGQIVHGDFTVAKKTQNFNVGMVQPYFLDRNLTASGDVFRVRSTRFSAYTYHMTGFSSSLGYGLSDYWTQSVTYSFKHDHVGHIAPTASNYIRQQHGKFYTSSVGQSIAYDRRDSRSQPTSGYILSLGNTYAGLGGNVQYLKNDLGANAYYPVMDEVVFGVKGALGTIERIRRKVRIVDSIFLGADTLRGFEYGGLGPRDMNTKDPLGGTRYWTSSAEVMFPLGLPNEFGIKGALFTDWGNTWRPSQTGPDVTDARNARGSVGFGVAMNLPIGPLRVDYAIPIKKQKFDQTQRILFGFATNF